MSHEIIGSIIAVVGIIVSLLSALIAKISTQATRITVLENEVNNIKQERPEERKILEAIRDGLNTLNVQVATLSETLKLQVSIIQKELTGITERVSNLEKK